MRHEIDNGMPLIGIPNAENFTEQERYDFHVGVVEIRKNSVRRERNRLLTETDWWCLPDTPAMTDEQKAYRQALRDITINFPSNGQVVWPTKP
jgi:hypothetical protein